MDLWDISLPPPHLLAAPPFEQGTPLSIPCPPGWLVQRLPTEILRDIFLRVLYIVNPYGNHSVLNWGAITRVCKTWSKIVLASPELWTQIVNASAPQARTLLTRSGTFPLSITFTIWTQKTTEGCLLVLKHWRRVRSLKIMNYNMNQRPPILISLLETLKQPSPLLEALDFEDAADPANENHKISLPLYAPQLHTLRFRGWGLCKAGIPLPTVRHLALVSSEFGFTFGEAAWPTVSTALSIIAAMPMLEILTWCNALGEVGHKGSLLYVSLPCLRSFTFLDSGPNGGHFLSHLNIPPTTSVKVDMRFPEHVAVDDMHTGVIAYSHIIQRRLLSPPDSQMAYELAVTSSQDIQLTIQNCHQAIPALSVSVEFTVTEDNCVHVLNSITTSLPHFNLQSISFYISGRSSKDLMRTFFEQTSPWFLAVRSLKLIWGPLLHEEPIPLLSMLFGFLKDKNLQILPALSRLTLGTGPTTQELAEFMVQALHGRKLEEICLVTHALDSEQKAANELRERMRTEIATLSVCSKQVTLVSWRDKRI